MSSTLPRILTGDTPTNTGLHLGHWVGSLEQRVALQDQYDCYFLIANIHAFTTLAEKPAEIRANTIGILKDWLAAGIDPDRCTIVLQSEVPAIAELTWFFAMLLSFNDVMGNPTLIHELETKGLKEKYSFGFPMYTVGQCADILAFRPELVPVGEDQEPHIEMCRKAARKFNFTYCAVNVRTEDKDHVASGGVFPVPRALIGRVGRLVGTDGKAKMSKSLNNAIFLAETEKQVQKKVNAIAAGRASTTSPFSEDSPLLQYIRAFLPRERADEIVAQCASGKEVLDGHLKAEVGAAINAILEPMRARRAKLEGANGDALVADIIKTHARKANAVAEDTLSMAKDKMELGWGRRSLAF